MYPVGPKDQPIAILTSLQSSIGAPCPEVLAGEHFLRLAYYVEEDRLGLEWQGREIRPEAHGDSDDLCAVVEFSGAYAHMFGPPNDEAFSGHPLATRGLRPYSVFEVAHSSWLSAFERMNSVHPYHRPESFLQVKHYVFSFHDTTFECIAKGFSVKLCRGSVGKVLLACANAL